jgi:citronellol/citronellal dehydrogenase
MTLKGKTLSSRRVARHRSGDRRARRARRRQRRDRREERSAASQAAGHDSHAAREVEEAGGKALAMQVDIRDENAVAQAAKQCAEHFGGIDILVNNASAISLSGTLETPMKRFDLMFGVNVRGTFVCSQGLPAVPQASGEGGTQSAHLELSPAAEHESESGSAARGVHDGEVRHEHVRARHGGRVPSRRHRRERACGRAQ